MADFIINDDGSVKISPIIKTRKKQKEEEKWYDEYFKESKGNGWQTFGYSALDALGNLTEGSLRAFEGVSDWGRNRGADIVDFFGADEYAKQLRERSKQDDTADIVKQWNHITAGDISGTKSEEEIGHFKKVEENSVFGDKADQVFQGVGNSLTSVGVGALSGGTLATPSFVLSAAGNAETEALNNGATAGEARMYGLISGAIEYGSERLFGGLGKTSEKFGLGKGALDDQAVKLFTKNMKNSLMKNITTLGIKSVGEGLEEVASGIGNAFAQKITYMNEEEIGQLLKDQKLMDSFVSGMLSSALMQSPSTITSTAQGRDVNTGLTRTQQQYVNEIAQQRMVEAQRRNAKLNGYEKGKIEDRALTDFQKGRLIDASKLQQVNLPGLSNKDMDLQQSAYKYGINPNSEFVVTTKTMLDNRGIKSRFDADAFKGSNENSYWTKKTDGTREVVFNPNASADVLLEEIAIHELTHDLMSSENSKGVIENQKIMDYVSTLDGYKESRAKLEKIYANQTKGMNKQKANALINEEIVADTLGKNIGSQEYIRRLIDDEPSVAKNIYDWVVNKVANKNGVKNEKAYWNNVKNNFEKAYNMEYQGKGNKNDAKFDLSENALNEVSDVIRQTKEEAEKSSVQFVKLKDNTIKELVKYGIKDLPMLERSGHVRENILTETEAKNLGYSTKNKHYHGLGVKTYLEIIDAMDNATGVYQYISEPGRFIVETPIKIKGVKSVVPIMIEQKGRYNNVSIDFNKIRTVFSPDSKNYISNLLKKGTIKEVVTGDNSQQVPLVANNVTQSRDNVKSNQKYSMSEQLENQASNLVEEDIQTRNAMLDNFKSYLEEYDITNPTQEDIDNSLIDLLGYDNDMTPAETLKYEKQYKEVVNEYLREQNQDVRYSLTDNQGRELTKEQQEWSKDSKVRDENGNLLTMYHGSPKDFTVFDRNYSNANNVYGDGLYFTSIEELATNHSKDNKLYEVYLNVVNPLQEGQQKITKEQIKKYVEETKLNKQSVDFVVGKDATTEDIVNYLYDSSDDFSILELIDGFSRKNNLTKTIESFNEITGTNYDGIITNRETVVFNSNQIKNVDNLNPTDDADIRYSLSTEDLKQKQLDIILKSNPAEDDYHTWIRSVDDIKTYEEALQEELDGETQGLTPDFKKADLEKALETGKMTVYSSYPIEQGIFVTPSKMEAQSYAGSEKVYSKEISLDDVAWIDTLQGQYAKVQPSDIRNSQQTEGWQSFLDKNFEAKGTKTRLSDIKLPGLTKTVQEEVQKQTSNALLPIANELRELNKNLNKVMNPTEISQLTPQDANTTPNLPGINRNQVGDGRSKFFDNIKDKTNMLNDEQKTAILNSEDVKYYDKVTNKDSLDKAFERLQENGQSESLRWFNKASESADATDVAEGWILLKQYADSGDTNGMVEVAKKLRDMGTKAGQTVQAFNILSRLTPEGMVKYAQSELLEAYDNMVKNKSAKWIEDNRSKFDLQPNEVQFIMDTMREVSTMEDGYDKRFKLAQIQKVLTDKLPPTKGAGLKAWMRISMLFNPKTQIRNIAGNAVIAPVNAFGDMFSSLADKVIGAKTGVRTTGNFNLKNYAKGFKTGLYQSYNDFKNGVNTRNIEGNRFEVTEGKSFNDNNAIGKALNTGDRGFYEASFVNSINNQMVLNNTTEVTQDMIDIATQEALSRTWQDNNEYTKFVMNVRNGLNKLNIGGYGLGDVLIPFAKTPANLTKAIVEYSPVGLIGTINKGIKLNRSLTNGQYSAKTQHEFVQSLGKATAGTMFYVLGLALANADVTTGESDEDKDVSNFMKNTLGVNSYSIKIGDMSFTYDWAQPLAAPLAITANLVQKQKEEASLLENVVSTLDTAGNLLLEQSFMESISTVLNNNEGIATGMQEAILDLPARAIPTFLKQITDLTDGTQRQTFVKDKPIESMFNSIKAKIPGLSYTLDPSVDTLGREIQKYGGKNNLFNVFLNPANVSTENVSESAQEIYRLYKETGETNIMPRVAPYYVNKKGEKIILTTQQRTQYQKVSGAIVEENVANLLSSTTYQNMSDTKKAETINDIVNYSYNIAQNQVLGTELSDSYQTAYEYAQIGDISDFYEFRNSIDDTDANTKRTSIVNYLYNSDLEDNQIANLYGNYYSSDKTINAMLELRIPIKEFIKFDSADIQGQYNSKKGQTISGSKKNATIEYVNTLNLSKAQRAILVKSVYSSHKSNDNDIIRYVNTLPGTANEKKVLLKSIGFDAYDDDVFNYINSQNISKEEKIMKLKELGFTVRNGRVYY